MRPVRPASGSLAGPADAARRRARIDRLLWERTPVRYALVEFGPFSGRPPRDAAELRRWLTPALQDRPYLHGHFDDGPHAYPLFQYKVTSRFVGALALEEAVPDAIDVARALGSHALRLGSTDGITGRFHLPAPERPVLAVEDDVVYQFVSPWIPFDGEEQAWFDTLLPEERPAELARRLVNHLVAFAKALDRRIPFEVGIDYSLEAVRSTYVQYRGERRRAFYGAFRAPVRLPPYLGLGHGMAIGFGATVSG